MSSEIKNLIVETSLARYDEERYHLYRKYQVAVHHDKPDDITPESFTRFLIESPLQHGGKMCGSYSCGTYHQLYRLDGVLIAVGVLDFLPSGVSSVYCFYDPDMRHLVLGKYTALREIDFTKSIGAEFYYMGFYIHSCPKMRYKADYQPSELLCPTAFDWHPLESCLPLLNQYRFTPFREDLSQRRALVPEGGELKEFAPLSLPLSGSPNVNTIPLEVGNHRQVIHISHLTRAGQEIVRKLLIEWILLTSQPIADRIIVKF